MLNHNNVVKAFSAVQVGESIVFAMEFVEGEDLDKVVRRQGPLPVPYACHYVSQAAMGLQHAHEHQMVHRDIKPQNLILSRQIKKHVVKVLDFGLAKAKREGEAVTDLTGVGAMMGTPAYMAPEQAQDAASADIRADVYSLGCTLYFLLTGAPPFTGKSLFEVLQAHVSTEAAPLSQVRTEAPAELSAVVARMMAKDPAKRFQKPIEAALALAPFIKPGSQAKGLIDEAAVGLAGERPPERRTGSGPHPAVPTPPTDRAPKRPERKTGSGPYPQAILLTDKETQKGIERTEVGGELYGKAPPARREATNEIVWAEVDGVLYGAPTPVKRTIGDTGSRPTAPVKKKANPKPVGSAPRKGSKIWWAAACVGVVVVLLVAGEVWLWNNPTPRAHVEKTIPVAESPPSNLAPPVQTQDLKPDNAVDHFNLGCDQGDKGRWDEAIAEYRRAIQLKPDYAEAHLNLGFALGRKGQPEEEIAEYRRAVALKPDYALAHFDLGCSLAEKHRWDEAIAEHRRAVALKPDYAEAHNNLAIALDHNGQQAEATAERNKAAELRKAQQK